VPTVWQWPGALDWLFMAAIGMVSGLSHVLLVGAFRRADAATLAPLREQFDDWAATIPELVAEPAA
jgi:drug/metabolite transporter (DMT)-like permease